MNVPQLPSAVVQAFDTINGLPRSAILIILAIMNQAQIFRSPLSLPLEFDYIIVGGGVAGCVVANRLSEDPDVTVLLLEAGGEGNVITRLPIGTFYLWDSVFDWQYRTVSQKYTAQYLNDRQVKLPAGKILGGGSMLNTILWVRGTRYDYQRWSNIGITGWSYEENLPYYMKTESVQMTNLQSSKRRGYLGPIVINYNSYQSTIAQGMINAGGEYGYRTDHDYNDKYRLGFSRAQSDISLGMRYDAARGYIDPIRERRHNLFVLTQAMATKVLFKGKTATGVVFEKNGREHTAYADREVIIAAGGIGSPKLLLLSGVGPADHLKRLGIPQIHELPVGKGLQDHVGSLATSWTLKGSQLVDYAAGLIPNNVSLNSPIAGFSNLIDWTGFINTKTGPDDARDYPDIQFMGVEIGTQTDFGSFGWRDFNFRKDVWEKTFARMYFKNSPTVVILTILLDYKTRGEVRLRSRDPYDQPIVDIQYLSHPEERETFMEGVKFARTLFASDPMRKFEPRFLNVPLENCSHPADANNDGYLECLAMGFPTTIFHYSSTMRMGSVHDPGAVVDNNLRMIGLNRIRVVDTSVLPYLGSGNPQATNYMVAEKAADIIKGKGMLPPIFD
jgi:choline dehydrogenase-like flavoprotein